MRNIFLTPRVKDILEVKILYSRYFYEHSIIDCCITFLIKKKKTNFQATTGERNA